MAGSGARVGHTASDGSSRGLGLGAAMKIGLLVSRSGPAGLWAPSADAGAMVAAAEINAAGGVLGRRIELMIADVGWSERQATTAAETLVEVERVDAVVGMHPSN